MLILFTGGTEIGYCAVPDLLPPVIIGGVQYCFYDSHYSCNFAGQDYAIITKFPSISILAILSPPIRPSFTLRYFIITEDCQTCLRLPKSINCNCNSSISIYWPSQITRSSLEHIYPTRKCTNEVTQYCKHAIHTCSIGLYLHVVTHIYMSYVVSGYIK